MKIKELFEDKQPTSAVWKILFHPNDGAGPAYPQDQVDKLMKQLNKVGSATLIRSTDKNLEIKVQFDTAQNEEDVWSLVDAANLNQELGWGGRISKARK